MKLKLEIKQIENVLLIKVPNDMDFNKLDKNALGKANINLRDTFYVNSILKINNINLLKTYRTYHPYKFDTEQQATEKREKIERTIAKYNESLELKDSFDQGEEYWFIDNEIEVLRDYWYNHRIDILHYQNNNVFKTKEEAQRKLDIINFINENKYNFTEKEWEDFDINKYTIRANAVYKNLSAETFGNVKNLNNPYFKDQETAQKVADFIGYDDFMKYC